MKLQTSLLLLLISYQMLAQSLSVYPGDFNMDGRVSIHDVLYWGQAYDETGLLRPNATLEWLPQDATDWGDSIRKVDFKYIDSNGDGMIDTLDLEAVLLNYDSIHTEVIKDTLDEFTGFLVTSEYTLVSSTIMERRYSIDIKATASTPTGGLALTFDYSSFEAPIAVRVDTTDSWLEPDILFVVDDTINKQLHIVVTRTDQMDRSDTGDGEVLFNIFICEDVASLTNYNVDVVNFLDVERMNSNEGRYFVDSIGYDPVAPLDSVSPLCRRLYDAEQCQYRNGTQDGDSFDEYTDGFRGDFSDEVFVSIGMACRELWDSDTLLNFDTLQFYIKVNEAGLGSPLYFDIDNIQQVNIGDFTEGNTITTDYKLVSIPIDMIGGEQLDAIEWLNFRTDAPLEGFYVDVDLMTARNNPSDTLIIWNGGRCGYGLRGRLNEEHARSGKYCYEAIPDGYGVPSIGLSCEKEGLAWRQDLRASDSLVFYTKIDILDRKFGVSFNDKYCTSTSDTANVLDYIEGGVLDMEYKRVSIPISVFQTPVCLLSAIEIINFPTDTNDFRFFIDDIHVVSYNQISPDIDSLKLCEAVSTTSIPAEIIEEPFFSIYPNPLTIGQAINLTTEKTMRADIRISDITGKIYYQSNQYLQKGNNQLTTFTDLPPGMYFLNIFDKQTNQFGTQKLLILNL